MYQKIGVTIFRLAGFTAKKIVDMVCGRDCNRFGAECGPKRDLDCSTYERQRQQQCSTPASIDNPASDLCPSFNLGGAEGGGAGGPEWRSRKGWRRHKAMLSKKGPSEQKHKQQRQKRATKAVTPTSEAASDRSPPVRPALRPASADTTPTTATAAATAACGST